MGNQLFDRAKMTVSGAPGVGVITLAAAASGYRTFAAAGVANGQVVSALTEEAGKYELGPATYSSTGPTLTRGTPTASSNGDATESFTSAATVTIVPVAADLIGASALTGAVLPFAMATAPAGWLECDGALVSRTTYAALFALIAVTYGAGDGSTTFKLPDLRGRFVRGWDHGAGVDTGRAIGTAQADDVKGHTHTAGMFNSGGIVGTTTFPAMAGSAAGNTGTMTTASTGGTESRPKNIALLYCIKT